MCIAAAAVGGAVVSGVAQSQAADSAADAQSSASRRSISEQRRQFDAIQRVLAPYVEAGTGSIGAQEALLGLDGSAAQSEAIANLESSPQFQALVQQGEEAILQNASATGGLRGGNVQTALAQYRPQVLSQLIESQFNRLGQVSGLGQAAAAGQAAASQNSANAISNLLTQQGQAQAGSALAQGQAIGQVGNSIGSLATLSALGAF